MSSFCLFLHSLLLHQSYLLVYPLYLLLLMFCRVRKILYFMVYGTSFFFLIGWVFLVGIQHSLISLTSDIHPSPVAWFSLWLDLGETSGSRKKVARPSRVGREGLSFFFSWDWLTNDDSLTPPSAWGLRSQIMSTESTLSYRGFPQFH